MGRSLKLHGFFNSSASYRVRIALALKGITVEHVGVDLRAGAQTSAAYRRLNPSGLVPALEDGTRVITQSLAIIDHLDRLQPQPRLIPVDDAERDRVLEIALLIACDIHPLNNVRVLKQLTGPLDLSEVQKNAWYGHWIHAGFEALEKMLPDHDGWCVGVAPTLADCCLVPQVANAQRMNVGLASYPRIRRIHDHAVQHAAFARAAPSLQPDYIAP